MIDFNLTSEGFDIETEIMAQIAKRKMSAIEYVIGYKSRSLKDGKKIKLLDSLVIFKKECFVQKFFSLNLSHQEQSIFLM